MKVVTPEVMRSVDSRAIDDLGVPGLSLMENAGRSIAEWVLDYLPKIDLAVVLAGRGNNGGDGLVAARYLSEAGREVWVILLKNGKELTPDCQANLDQIPENIEVTVIDNDKDLKSTLKKLDERATRIGSIPIEGEAIFIDALLGTGVSGEIRGPIVDLLRAAQALGWKSVAADIPSGIDGTNGSFLGAAIPAVATVTMGLPKTGLYLGAGIDYSGKVYIADIGFPDEAIDDAVPSMETIEGTQIGRIFEDDRSRPDEKALHKGDFGRVLVVAGSRGMIGANELVSRAALRTGAGLVVSAIPESEYPILASRTGPEIMTAPVSCDQSLGCFSPGAVKDLEKLIDWGDVLALGPGFSRNEPALQFARDMISAFPDTHDHQVIIDADALMAFNEDVSPLSGRKRPPIITPHPGEFAKLTAAHKLPEDKLDRLIAYSKMCDCVVILKGARTLVADPREDSPCPVAVNVECGNPGMATAGSGDVLTGILAGLAGQTTIAWDPFQIACAGVYVHGKVGDLAAKRKSRTALIAGDLIDFLPRLFSDFAKRGNGRSRGRNRRRQR